MGDVRGQGLFIGIDLIANAHREADGTFADAR
jgi:4-aminobutyrate aminotransferase-like enzyme